MYFSRDLPGAPGDRGGLPGSSGVSGGAPTPLPGDPPPGDPLELRGDPLETPGEGVSWELQAGEGVSRGVSLLETRYFKREGEGEWGLETFKYAYKQSSSLVQ